MPLKILLLFGFFYSIVYTLINRKIQQRHWKTVQIIIFRSWEWWENPFESPKSHCLSEGHMIKHLLLSMIENGSRYPKCFDARIKYNITSWKASVLDLKIRRWSQTFCQSPLCSLYCFYFGLLLLNGVCFFKNRRIANPQIIEMLRHSFFTFAIGNNLRINLH